ncbi:RING-type E3 ubiquitin transferase [Heracleum sosnowskyi]|uniref:RING-type E3 ubiquitin transferase n=2 Tax=Heracleum sosnowskyi TaxID=360622 RepID=A0AAD8GP97_9APIA|nr:RING-type E3 ubiquitin transferase [Heracleum sosnowskyi]
MSRTPSDSASSSQDLFNPNEIESESDTERVGQVRIQGRRGSVNGNFEGGVRTQRIRPQRHRHMDLTSSEEAEESGEEGRRGQVRGRGRGRGRARGRGRGRERRHEGTRSRNIAIPNFPEMPEIDNSQATNCIEVGSAHVQSQINQGGTRSGIAVPNSLERPETPETGNSQATNCIRVGSIRVQPQINEGGTRSGNIAIPISPKSPEIGNCQATNCTRVGRTLVQPQINEGGTRSGNIAIPNSPERPDIGSSQATNCTGVGSALVQPQISEGGTRSENIAFLDISNMLECLFCSKTFSIPVYQCVKGHPACSSCCSNLNNKCPSCSEPINDIRCLLMEELLKRVKVTCLNSKYGCKEILSYIMKCEHEQSCAYEPCYCPVPGCGFDGSYRDLYRHFAREHPDSATHFTFDSYFPVHVREDMESIFLQERDHTLFILNYGVQNFGSVAYIICMGPSCLRDKYSYELEASSVNRGSFKFSWPWIESLTKWTVDLSDKNGLVLPKVFIDSSWDQKIKVCIRRKGEN